MSEPARENPSDSPLRSENAAPSPDMFADEILPDRATQTAARNKLYTGGSPSGILSECDISGNSVNNEKLLLAQRTDKPKSASKPETTDWQSQLTDSTGSPASKGNISSMEAAVETKATGTVKLDDGTSMTFKDGLAQKTQSSTGVEIKFQRDNPEKPEEVTDLEHKDLKIPSLEMHVSRLSGVQTREYNGTIEEITDPKRNFRWQRQPNGDWTVNALNSHHAFSPPIHVMRGKAERTSLGGYSFIDENSQKYRFKADGSADVVKHGTVPGKEPGTSVTYKDDIEQEMRFKGGFVATFRHDNTKAANEITSLEFKGPKGESTKLTRVPGQQNQFTDGKNTYAVNYETKDGQLAIHKPEQRVIQYQCIDDTDIYVDTNTGITTTERGHGIEEVADPNRNYHFLRQSNGDWKIEALDQRKPFLPPSEKIAGNYHKLADGGYKFMASDGLVNRFKADGSHDLRGDINGMKEIRDKINKTTMLTKEQKDRILNNYLPNFDCRDIAGKSAKESEKEKIETIAQLSTLLDNPLPGAYSDVERAKILEQTAFQLANETNLRQHLQTCNVTDIGATFLHESPSHFARFMAELGNTGQFRTKDGSTIVPSKEDIQEALKDQPFPPDEKDPRATGVSRAFAIAAANIHWQRRDMDVNGNSVALGSLKYQQSGGEGVFLHQNGKRFYVNDTVGKKIEQPNLDDYELIDVAEQISGETWNNKVVVSKNLRDQVVSLNKHSFAANKQSQVAAISSAEDLHNALLKNKIQIVQVHTGNPPFYDESGYGTESGAGGPKGGWHVVVKTHYEPVFDANNKLDINKSLVYFDNTWNPNRFDHLTKTSAIPLAMFLKSMSAPS